jgi:hypothetical protein
MRKPTRRSLLLAALGLGSFFLGWVGVRADTLMGYQILCRRNALELEHMTEALTIRCLLLLAVLFLLCYPLSTVIGRVRAGRLVTAFRRTRRVSAWLVLVAVCFHLWSALIWGCGMLMHEEARPILRLPVNHETFVNPYELHDLPIESVFWGFWLFLSCCALLSLVGLASEAARKFKTLPRPG